MLSRRQMLGLLAGAAAGGLAVPARAAALATRRAARLARGFNLPDWQRPPAPAVLDALRNFGLTTIRLPIDGALFAGADATARRAASRALAAMLRRLTAAGYTVTVDLHRVPAPATDAVPAWEALRHVVADSAPEDVFAELLNEPPLARAQWLPLRDRLAETIRKTCPDHTLIWGAARYQGIWETVDLEPLADPNSIVAVHYYAPMGFTHQCENWDGSPLARLGNLPFPASADSPAVVALAARLAAAGDTEALTTLRGNFAEPWTEAHIAADFAPIARWSDDHICPVILNEFGALNFCVEPESRTRWAGVVRRAAETSGLGWCYWELDQGFGLIADRQSTSGFDLPMLGALLDLPR